MRSNARQRSEETTVERHIGQFQVCEGDFKLLGGLLVHHGYRRPGYGEIVGDCPGVYEMPYEVSSELVKGRLARTEKEAERANSSFEALKRDDLSELTQKKKKFTPELSPEYGEVEAKPDPLSRDMYLVTYSRATTPRWLWSSLVKDKLQVADNYAKRLNAEVDHLRHRVNDWELKPIRTVEEEVAKKRSAVAERKGAKEAARSDAKAQKGAKLAAQEAAREEKARKFIAKHEPEIAAAKDYLVEILKEYRQLLPQQGFYAVRAAMYPKTRGVAELFKGLSQPIVDAVIDLAGLNKEVDELGIRSYLGGSSDYQPKA